MIFNDKWHKLFSKQKSRNFTDYFLQNRISTKEKRSYSDELTEKYLKNALTFNLANYKIQLENLKLTYRLKKMERNQTYYKIAAIIYILINIFILIYCLNFVNKTEMVETPCKIEQKENSKGKEKFMLIKSV